MYGDCVFTHETTPRSRKTSTIPRNQQSTFFLSFSTGSNAFTIYIRAISAATLPSRARLPATAAATTMQLIDRTGNFLKFPIKSIYRIVNTHHLHISATATRRKYSLVSLCCVKCLLSLIVTVFYVNDNATFESRLINRSYLSSEID